MQLAFYEKLLQANNDYPRSQTNPLKRLRDRVIHNLSHRPVDAVPVGKADPDLPQTVEEMYQLILQEQSRVREATLIMAAIVRAKTPENIRIKTSESSAS
jgi:hypothetical protein